MAEKLDLFYVQSLSGGLNLRSEDYMLQGNEGSEVQNFLFNADGSLTKRNGSVLYNSATISSGKPIGSLYRFYKSTTTAKKMLSVCDGTLYEGDDTLGTWASKGSLGADTSCSFETWEDTCYIANGTVFKQWDGTTLSDVSGSPPIGKYVVFRKDRLYVAGVSANPNRLYFCDTGDPTTWNAGTNYIDIRSNDGDVITGIMPMRDYLVIYKRNSIWLLSGNSAANFFLTQVSETVGCKASGTLVPFENVHYFLHDTGIYAFDGSSPINVSDKVQPEIDGIQRQYFENAKAVVYKRQYWLSYTASGTANNSILAHDLRLGVWSILKGLFASSFCIWAGGDDSGEIYAGDSQDGFVRKLDTGTADDGAEIETKFMSKSFDLDGNPLRYKEIKQIFLITSLSAISPTVILTLDWGNNAQPILFPISDALVTWDSTEWDASKWSGGGIQKLIKPTVWNSSKSARGQNVSLTVQETSLASWKLIGFGFAYRPEPSDYKILAE